MFYDDILFSPLSTSRDFGILLLTTAIISIKTMEYKCMDADSDKSALTDKRKWTLIVATRVYSAIVPVHKFAD